MTQKKSNRNLSRRAPPNLNSIRDLILEAADAAGKVLRKHFRGKLKVAEKPGAGLVTNADLEAQEKIVKILRAGLPKFGFLTEEAKPEAAQCPGRWIIDPLDGTTNFIHGFPMFCVSIAAEWDHQMIAGTIYHPILDESYLAVRGKGASLNGKKLLVSQTTQISHALFTTSLSHQKGPRLQHERTTCEELSHRARAVRRPGSAALDLAYTAAGVFDAFWGQNLSLWDVAAGSLLVQEAGGKISHFGDNLIKQENQAILASNSLLHKKLLHNLTAKKPLPF
jgi:myo-inositol-1(or 4)-monophosphatase